ncbi:MAG: DNA polymerase I [Bacillota bacterium]
MAEKILLVDGNSLVFRAFHGIPGLVARDGTPTNAVYGLLSMLLKVLKEEEPDYVAVAFDLAAPTFRQQSFAAYKANRQAMPDQLAPQFPLAKEAIGALGLTVVELEGYEADDLIGTIARRATEAGLETVIVTGDKDSFQLIGPSTRVAYTVKGISQLARYDEAAVQERYGLTPGQLIDLKGLAGDTSDNIPGVPGIGEKTALKLLVDFGSLEAVLANLDRVKGERLQRLLKDHSEQARLSRQLATIDRAVPLATSISALRRRPPDKDHARSLFSRLEFSTLIDRLGLTPEAPQPAQTELAGLAHTMLCLADLGKVAELARGEGRMTLALPVVGRAAVGSLAMRAGGESFCVEFAPGDAGQVVAALGPLLADEAVRKVGHGLKPAISWLAGLGVPLRGLDWDGAVASYLVDPGQSTRVEDLARRYLQEDVQPIKHPGPGQQCGLLELVERLRPVLEGELSGADMLWLYREVELPLIPVLAGMEAAGMGLDRARLREMNVAFTARLEELTQAIHGLAGMEFNIQSTRQLGEVLFAKLGLPPVKKTKTGYSTDAEVLEALAPSHAIVRLILEHRQLSKLKGTYVDGLENLVDQATGRIHTTFHQIVTATGRLSSSDPNLQNIPVRFDLGRQLRRVFVPATPGRLFLCADYSQIELRVLAHLAGDEVLQEAFRRGEDIHCRTAAEVFGVPMASVTEELRDRAKAVNFGIVYGISDFGLSRNLGISRREAAEYIEGYFQRYSGVKRFASRVIAEGRERGYVTTILNRRRYLPDLHNRNWTLRQFAERTAVNTPIQGSAADIIKLAMVRLAAELKAKGLQSRLVLQVHDELICEAPPAELGELKELVHRSMATAFSLSVPLVVDLKQGPNWYELTEE